MNFGRQLNRVYRAWRYRLKVERPEIAYLLRHVTRGQTVLDIGAHKGAYTYWMQKLVGPTGHVFAFEPQPELARNLRELVATPALRQVHVVEAAVSSKPGSLRLFRPSSQPSPGATLEFGRDLGPGESFSVQVESLDHFFASAPGRPIHFIKCDVEGHELDAFHGAEKILREDKPRLLFECEPRHHANQSVSDVFDYLQGLGYTGSFFRRDLELPLTELSADDQVDPRSPGYVNNFVFVPIGKTVASRKSA